MNAIALKMKRATFVLALLSFLSLMGTRAMGQGIEFFHGTWAEALAKSRAEGKPIFVDAYTDWCGPCKWMSANIFTKPEVGAYFNSNFINVKLDMEKGEGPTFARNYKVMAYPTLLFMDSVGNVKLRQQGAPQTADVLIGLGKTAKGS
jgi:thiol:disulfide interchange protein